MKRSLLSLALCLLTAMQMTAYKQQSININVGGQQRNMVVFTPNAFPDKSPLFIVTHGMNQNPEYQYGADKMYEMIDTAKFVIAYLRSDGNTWDIGGTKDQNFVIKTIDEMAARYNIDTDRVYWSGFSMGSMLIHHCIGAMQDKIAAFAPTSGIQFSESPWNNCQKPVNLLECIAYGDDVFGYEQYGIHNYIENYAKHDKHPNYSKTEHYRPISTSWYDGDLEKWTGGPNGGEVWLYSYNNGGHWPMDLNRHLIWNFCKRFSLNNPTVKIIQPAGETSHLYMAPQGEAQFDDITIRATAKAAKGKIEQMDFYDGNVLLTSRTAMPYQTTLSEPTAAVHNLRVEVKDTEGRKAEATCRVNYIASRSSYTIHQGFSVVDVVPQDWYVSDGSAKRVGGSGTYTTGPRLLHFTNATRAFDYGLLVQNNTGKERAAWAKYGTKTARSRLTLHAGQYTLRYKVCNWNQPDFSPVIISIQDTDGQELASETFTPTINIGGDAANRFSKFGFRTFTFDIPTTGDYVIVFYPDAQRNADFVLGNLSIHAIGYDTTGIPLLDEEPSSSASEGMRGQTFDLQGRRHSSRPSQKGIYIRDGRKAMVH